MDDEQITGIAGGRATPSELMRSWHPEMFSDCTREHAPAVPREVLDHHLDTLTNRKQEIAFEYFARLLAERELCPNLRPQTGPHGGGDGKVDSETYPVAPELAEAWFEGDPAAAGERWAFAFSTKRDWRGKVRADVRSIVGTGRGYSRVYCVTSRYAPDRPRSEMEEELSASAGVPVTILDRSWILEKVYANDRLELAVRALDMQGYARAVEKRLGPRDVARAAELKRLDAQVADQARYAGRRYDLVEDMLERALLARGLERPREEVEGRFLAAERAARNGGHPAQRQRVAYQRAWTAHWWFDDPAAFDEHYEELATLALPSDEASDLERVFNLWNLLGPMVQTGALTAERARIEERGADLRAALERVASNAGRPNNAAQARTWLILIRAVELLRSGEPGSLPTVWTELVALISGADRLGDYPVERVHELIVRLGEFVPESAEFDALHEAAVGLLERHVGEARSGTALMERGMQKLRKGREHAFDAIRMLGRAETSLIKAEYVDELVGTLVAIGEAYRRVGLRWVARAKALTAADRLLADLARSGRLDPRAAVPLKFLAWIELELGRVPQALAAIDLYRIIAHGTEQPPEIARLVPENLMQLEAVLGILLMRADLNQLGRMEQVPALLERERFEVARGAALFALGGPDAAREGGFAPAEQADEDVTDFFTQWLGQPAAEQLPKLPVLALGPEVELHTRVLGVEVVARAAANADSILLGETVLAALESFLSTSLDAGVFPWRERLDFAVRPGAGQEVRPVYSRDEATRAVTITHGAGVFAGAPDYAAFSTWVQEAILKLTLEMVMIRDPDAWMGRVAGDEVAFGRALALGAVGVATRNLFGAAPKVTLTDWLEATDARVPLTRTTVLATGDNPRLAKTASAGEEKDEEEVVGAERPGGPSSFRAPFASSHADSRVVSAIDVPLWERARWGGTAFGSGPDAPPLLCLAFRDYEAGQAIFAAWRERFGAVDQEDALRISIVRGIDRQAPFAYAVVVSSERPAAGERGALLLQASRINRMDARDPANLERFLAEYASWRRFDLAPVLLDPDARNAPIDTRLAIGKQRLVVRDAWSLGLTDPEICCIDPADEPLVPESMDEYPLRLALETLRRGRAVPGADPG